MLSYHGGLVSLEEGVLHGSRVPSKASHDGHIWYGLPRPARRGDSFDDVRSTSDLFRIPYTDCIVGGRTSL